MRKGWVVDAEEEVDANGWYGNVRSERICDSTWKSTSLLLAFTVL